MGRKYTAYVNEEVSQKFLEFCAGQQQTPYDVLSELIYKLVGMKKKEHVPSAYERTLEARKPFDASAARVAGAAAKQASFGPRRTMCCSNDCFSNELQRCKESGRTNSKWGDERS